MIRRLTIRARILISSIIALGLLLFLWLFFLEASNRLHENQESLQEIAECIQTLGRLENAFHSAEPGDPGLKYTSCLKQTDQLRLQLENLNPIPLRQITLIERFNTSLRRDFEENQPVWVRSRADLQLFSDGIHTYFKEEKSATEALNHKTRIQVGIVFTIGLLLLTLSFFYFFRDLSDSLGKILRYTKLLKKGELPDRPDQLYSVEVQEIVTNLDLHVNSLKEKQNLIQDLSTGSEELHFKSDAEDLLGKALEVLSETLAKKEVDARTRNREDNQKNWVAEGSAQMGDILRAEGDNIDELCFAIIQKLVIYMKVEMGSMYLVQKNDKKENTLELKASYAYERRKYIQSSLEWGEGLPGTCAREGKQIYLTEVPEDYFHITSGTGSVKPNCLLLIPLITGARVVGVIELATVKLLRPFEIEFAGSLAESIASTLLSVQTNEHTNRLLNQIQKQVEDLQNENTRLNTKLGELDREEVISQKKLREIGAVLQAMDEHLLMAELGPTGRYLKMNAVFSNVLGLDPGQVAGKLHSEFARVEANSEKYKEFWSRLKQGETIRQRASYQSYSGSEVWLEESFTPVLNDDGRIKKFLVLARDISESLRLEKELQSSEQEVSWKTRDMQSLNLAVNSSLITCVLDADGLIAEVNDKYCEVRGYSSKELLGRNYRLFLKESEKEQFEKIWTEIQKGRIYEGVVRRSKPTGEEVWLLSTFSPLMNSSDELIKVYILGLDNTEKRLKYQLLEEANLEIERLKNYIANLDTD